MDQLKLTGSSVCLFNNTLNELTKMVRRRNTREISGSVKTSGNKALLLDGL